METELHQLLQARTQLKARVTTAANKISTAISRTKPITVLEALVDVLEDEFSQFNANNEYYCVLITTVTDESVNQFKTANGLDLNSYYDQVESVYKAGVQYFIDYEKSISDHKVKSIINDTTDLLDNQANSLIKQFTDFCESEGSDESINSDVFDEAEQCITKLNQSLEAVFHINIIDRDEFGRNVKSSILKLESKVFLAKQVLRTTRTQQASPARSTPHNLGPNSLNPSQPSVHPNDSQSATSLIASDHDTQNTLTPSHDTNRRQNQDPKTNASGSSAMSPM